MITILTAPKPFTDPQINLIQRNAIQSWNELPEVDVLLMGNEAGIAEAAAEFGARQVADVPSSESGLPLISGMFDRAREASNTPLLAYVNADILLLPDFVEAARNTARQTEEFLLVGQRWNLEVTDPIDFSSGYEVRLRDWVAKEGELYTLTASDFFVFPRDLFTEVPDLLVGRSAWDNWMMYYGTSQRWPTVDVTADVLCIHQNHDYAHLPGGQPHFMLEESQENIRLAGGRKHMYQLIDVNKRLVGGRLRPQKYRLARWLHKIELALETDEMAGRRWELARRVWRVRRRLMLHYARKSKAG
jgi:hypothetical protein